MYNWYIVCIKIFLLLKSSQEANEEFLSTTISGFDELKDSFFSTVFSCFDEFIDELAIRSSNVLPSG